MGVMMMKKKEVVIVMMMAIMILGAQVQAQSNDIETSTHKRRHCASRCALKCLIGLKITPVTYMACFNLCWLKCKFLPSDSVFSCTSSCAHSKTLTLANTEAQDVEGYVESCYDKCSNKH